MPPEYIVLPAALTVLVISLTGLFIDVGRWPNFLLDFPIISLDTTQLKDDILQSSNFTLPITDVLHLYFQTHCEGNYLSTPSISPRLKDVTCSVPSSDINFLPANIIHLQFSKISSSEPIQLSAYNFAHQLGEIQTKFAESYHAELHIAFAIYAITFFFEGVILLLTLVSLWSDTGNWILGLFSILTTIFLLIGNTITTTFQYQAVATINQYGEDIGITGYRGTGFLVFIWTAFGVAFVATGAWGWGVWTHGRNEDSIDCSNHGGLYMNCLRDPVGEGIDDPVILELRRGKVVEVDGDGISLKPDIDYVRESRIGIAL